MARAVLACVSVWSAVGLLLVCFRSCCAVAVGVAYVGLRLLYTVGVRMACISFSAIDIYLYTDGVARSRARVVVCGVGYWLMYGCIKVLFRVVGGVVISMYLYNVLVACMVVVWWCFPCAYMDRYI